MLTASWTTKAEGGGAARAPDLAEVQQVLSLLIDPASTVELFSLFPARYSWLAGNDLEGLTAEVGNSLGSNGNFVAANPLPADFLGQPRTGAHVPDFSCRRWLPLDVDPVKPSKTVNATDAEHAAAADVMSAAVAFMAGKGAPDPLVIDTGGGWLALYRIELDNDDGVRALVTRLLKALAGAFDTSSATIDPGSSRVTFHARLPGTWNRKGPHEPDRPQRMVRLARIPSAIEVLPRALLEELAGPVPERPPRKPFRTTATGTEGEKNYVRKALEGECAAVAACTHHRNDRLNTAAIKLGHYVGAGLLAREEVERRLEEAACACGLDTDTPGLRGVRATIKSGLDAGEKKPHGVPESFGPPPSANGQDAKETGTPPTIELLRGVGLNVARIVQLGTPKGVYDLILEDGRTIPLGTTAEVLDPKLVRARVADVTHVVLPVLKWQEWGPHARAILQAAEIEDVGSDPQAELREWIGQFEEDNSLDPLAENDREGIVHRLGVVGIVVDEVNVVYLSLPKFQGALLALSPIRIGRADLIQRLCRDKFHSVELDVKPDGRRTTSSRRKQIRAWISPKGYFSMIGGGYFVPSVPSNPGGGSAQSDREDEGTEGTEASY